MCPLPRVSCSALLISGTVGAGKTSVAEMVGDLLAEAGVPNAVIDLDWLRRSWPSPAGDRFNVAMALLNLRSVARNYREAGTSGSFWRASSRPRSSATATRTRSVFPSRCADLSSTFH